MIGTVNLVKNFLATPAIAYPLYSSIFFSGITDVILDSYTMISYSYSIDPLFLKIPYMLRNYGLLFIVYKMISKGMGRPYEVSFFC